MTSPNTRKAYHTSLPRATDKVEKNKKLFNEDK